MLIFIHFLILHRLKSLVSSAYYNLSGKVGMLNNYSALIKTIESADFRSKKLSELQKLYLFNGRKASDALKELSQVVKNLDIRFHPMYHIPLNLLTFWDIHWLMKAERWKKQHRNQMEQWFASMAEFEALSSFANAFHNNPDWSFPEISEAFKIEAKEAGHPLILSDKRVPSDFSIDSKGKVMLITGSNMAGKSTFLRTAGVNMVLAMAGSAVCAAHFKVPPVKVFTSMRIADSLEENTSSFYAELKRLNTLIKLVEHEKNVFFLLDEILRGTNSGDRHIGSMALIRQLVRKQSTGMIATHDLELAKLEEEQKGKVENYHFDVQVENEHLYFDYRLHPGVCKSLNASVLMKKMGIEINE
jgi:DNA mismatch repair ATPase MutS